MEVRPAEFFVIVHYEGTDCFEALSVLDGVFVHIIREAHDNRVIVGHQCKCLIMGIRAGHGLDLETQRKWRFFDRFR